MSTIKHIIIEDEVKICIEQRLNEKCEWGVCCDCGVPYLLWKFARNETHTTQSRYEVFENLKRR